MLLDGKRVLITGGTGSLGQVLARRLLEGELGVPRSVVVFSRSEALQHTMRLAFQHRKVATDDIVYEEERHQRLVFTVGDIRDYEAVCEVLESVDVVFHAAAMKQVPTCEYHPAEAFKTNVGGAKNIVRAIAERGLAIETVIGISTDKACKPVNVMGMTKAIQERVLLGAGLRCPETRFAVARYGNVLASRGSVIPVFEEQIAVGGPVTITTPEMTRFLISLEEAVDTVFEAIRAAGSGETYVPRAPAARLVDVAKALMAGRDLEIEWIGIRPGEKVHEVLVSEEEAPRTVARNGYFVIAPILPELRDPEAQGEPFGQGEYSSAEDLIDAEAVASLLRRHRVIGEAAPAP
jgi:FlaA1/EpsC-like NDP-sugar epimerase